MIVIVRTACNRTANLSWRVAASSYRRLVIGATTLGYLVADWA